MRKLPQNAAAIAACAAIAASFTTHAFAIPNMGGGSNMLNGFEVPMLDPTGQCGPIGLEYDYRGNVVSQIPPQDSTDPNTNPFYALSQVPGYPASNPISISYDSGSNLTKGVFSGGPLPLIAPAGYSPPQYEPTGNPPPTYHTGMIAGMGFAPLKLLVSLEWLYSCNGVQSSTPLPVVSISTDRPLGENVAPAKLNYAGIFLQSANAVTGQWSLTAYKSSSKKLVFDVTNGGKFPVTIGLAGIVLGLPVSQTKDCLANAACPENQELLDHLNAQYDPAPGQTGSPYTLLKPPGTIKPGATFKL
jgi:hypothetical protein